MKKTIFIITFILIAVLLSQSALMSGLPLTTAQPAVSTWAEEEVAEARRLGIIPEGLPLDYTQPITRAQFRLFAMNFVALQEKFDLGTLGDMVAHYMSPKDAVGAVVNVFLDGSRDDSLAFYLGMVKGLGDGRFAPEQNITRQEAAVMLLRAYSVYGGKLPESLSAPAYSDESSIDGWATESVAAMSYWQVIRGNDDGSFSPKTDYTIEQCILTFLRLYNSCPVSIKLGNVTPIFSYEQSSELLKNKTGYTESTRIKSADVEFIRLDVTGVMQPSSIMYFLSRYGGLRRVDLSVGDKSYGVSPGMELTNPKFSEDGKTFSCSVVLAADVKSANDGSIIYKAGNYDIVLNV